MLSDPREREIAAALRSARPQPRAGWEERALAALSDIRPRRHPNLVTYIIVAALLLLLAAGVFAAVRHFFFVDGTLLFVDDYEQSPDGRPVSAVRVLHGELEWQAGGKLHAPTHDISYATGEALFIEGDSWPRRQRGDIIKAKLDGSDPVNLTQKAGMGGLNCRGRWSPDRSMIAFQHGDPGEDMLPCDAGFHIWVMGADGTDARQASPEDPRLAKWRDPRWSPDGSRLICTVEWGGDIVAATIDIWTQDVRVIPNVGHAPVWSPDGSMIVSSMWVEQEVDGEPGVWRALLLTNADGSDPTILVEQFIATADVEDRYPDDAMLEQDPSFYWVRDVLWLAGPRDPAWSPAGDKIAFLAALPFDPDGPFYRNQAEVWVYDLTTDELIRVTNDDVGQTMLHWK